MTAQKESRIWQKYAPTLRSYGLPIRLETSTQGGVPDIMYLVNNVVIFIELKQTKTRYVRVGSFQNAFHTRAIGKIRPEHDWFWIERKGVIECYMWQTLMNAPQITDNRSSNIKFDILDLPTDFIMDSPAQVKDWLELVTSKKENEHARRG